MVESTDKIELGKRLKALREAAAVSVEAIAEECDVSVQAVYKWFRTGEVAREHLPVLARLLKVSTDEILHGKPLIKTFHPADPADDEDVRIPEETVRFSGGPGHLATYEITSDREPATYRQSWFQKERINPNKAKRFRVTGNSMEPLLYPGDSILVNTEETQVREGLIYVFRHGDELKVKKLMPKADGSLVLRSINREEYPDDLVPAAQVAEDITIIGRVRDKSGRGGL